MNDILLRLKYRLRQRLSKHPRLFFAIYGTLTAQGRSLIDKNTEIVIEGFPRSGNTFALWAFLHNNNGVRIAHHSHSQAQVVQAVKKGLPVLVVVREPIGAIRSLLVRHSHITPRLALSSYLDFHRAVQANLPQVLLASMQEVTTDFGQVTRRINQKFGCSFIELDHNETTNRAIFENIDKANQAAYGELRISHLPRPHQSKEKLKQAVDLSSIEQELEQAVALYDDLMNNRQG